MFVCLESTSDEIEVAPVEKHEFSFTGDESEAKEEETSSKY